MEELKTVLIAHAKQYPLMQPTDAVKLIYQNEFGSGHLIRDVASCMDRLREEYAGTKQDPTAALYEEIGNGIVRVNLAAVKPEDVEPLGNAFIRCAGEHTGTMDSFLRKLEVLRQLTGEGIFSFDAQDLGLYLAEYRASGYPAVSHSPQYRQAYRPAYRIVQKRID